jgi:uncharacterized protein
MVLSPADIARDVVRMIETRDSDRFVDHFAEDGVMNFPFSAPGFPSALNGRAEVKAYYAAMAERRSLIDVHGVESTVRQTDDPEVVVLEVEHHGHSRAIDAPYRFKALGIIRVRDGKIVNYDDYMNPVALARITGRTQQLVEALTDA